ncbi:SH3-domain-containing protein, partial [Backusella circina FSU 941]
MSSPSLLCRVQAIYPFESDDPTSLRFEDGDFIDVLSKLPSGWWDGWCNGNRGWFPSNFVKAIEDSTASMKSNGIDSKRASLPSNWTLQTKSDGTPGYYYNSVTGEIRSTYPDD